MNNDSKNEAVPEEVNESENRLEEISLISQEVCSILNSLNEIVWSVKSDTLALIYISRSAESVFGRGIDEFSFYPFLWLDIIHPADQKRVRDFFSELPISEKAEIHYRILRPNRECRYIKHKAFSSKAENSEQSVIKGIITDVTELMVLQDKLKISKERYEAVVQDQVELIKRYFIDGTLTFANDAYCRFFGSSRDNLLGTSFMRLVPASQRKKIAEIIKSISSSNPFVSFEYEAKRHDGEKRWIKWIDRAIPDDNGVIKEIQSVGRDITDEKNAARLVELQKDLAIKLSAISDLREALNLCLKTAVEASNLDCGGIYILNESLQEFELQTWEGITDNCAVERASFGVDSMQAKMILRGHPVYFSADELPEGDKIPDTCKPLKGMALIPIKKNGRIIGSFNFASKKMTEISANSKTVIEAIAAQVGSTIDRIRAEEAVWESRHNLNLLFDSITDFIFIVNFNMTVVNVNNEVLTKLGYSRDEIIGKSICSFQGGNVAELAREASKTIIEKINGYCVVPLKTKDGRLIPVETKLTCGKWNDEDVIIGISRDVSERIRLQHDLENKDKELHDFTYTVSHDLRNPVNILKSFLVAIKEDPILFDGYFERVLKQSDRLKSFIDDMISLSRAGKTVVETMPVNLVYMLNRIYDEQQAANTKMELRISPDFVRMDSDPARMERLFNNLFTNSLQYFDGKKEKLVIDVAFRKNGDNVEIRFSDNGPGVDESNLVKIFEVGFTFNKNIRNGFGLPVCRKIAEAHGGRMWAEKNLSGNGCSSGLTFVMSFPADKFSFSEERKLVKV